MTDWNDEYTDMKPCPDCPDGGVWNANGPTGAKCKTCNGHAIVHLNGAALTKEEEKQRGY